MPDRAEPPTGRVPEVLFVCVHNAGRSQMAAALLDHHAKGRVHVRSAGSAPGDQINPAVAAAMDEQLLDHGRHLHARDARAQRRGGPDCGRAVREAVSAHPSAHRGSLRGGVSDSWLT